jgi:SAM-dependent methyltransferase
MRCFSPFYEEERTAEPLWTLGNHRIVRCADSGLIYLSNPPSEPELESFYSEDYFEGDPKRRGYASYAADEPVLRRNFRALLEDMAESLPDARSLDLLDYGCAYGYFLDEARSRFRSVRGVEISTDAAEVGRQRFGLDIANGGALPEGSADVVTMWDVIEHLGRPRSTLLEIARALRTGGRLFLTTGDVGSLLARALGARWRLVNPPQHITYFSEATLSLLLDACGLRVDRVERPGKRVSFSFFSFILRYLVGFGGEPLTLRWLERKSFYVNLFDVMFVAAAKK